MRGDDASTRTRAGLIMGTAAYMSPEQARAKPVDRRTDVWAFGCVLYELLARRAAFGAETASDCLVKVLESEPDWARLPRDTPEAIRRLLRRCLQKDAAVRLRDIADARLEVVEALSTTPQDDALGPVLVRRRRWGAVLLASGLALAAAAGAYIAFRAAALPSAGTVTQLTFRHGNIGKARFGPDGQSIVYSAAWNVEPFRLYAGGGDMHMTLEAITLSGRRRTVASYTGMIQIEDISADGKVLIAAGTLRFSVHGSTEGGERDLTVFEATRLFHLARNGRALLWDNSPGAGRDRVFLGHMDGAPVPLGPGAPAALTPDGKWAAVIGDGRSNQRIRNKLTLLPTGAGTARTIDLPIDLEPLHGDALGRTEWSRRTYDFSTDGTRLLIPFGHAPGRPGRVYVYDLSRNSMKPITPEGITGPAVIAPDGRFVAVNDNSYVRVYPVDEGEDRVLPGVPEPGHVAAWSSDGKSILMVEQVHDLARVFRRDVLSGNREFVRDIRVRDPAGVTAFDIFVSRDGQAYAYTKSLRLANVFVVEGLR